MKKEDVEKRQTTTGKKYFVWMPIFDMKQQRQLIQERDRNNDVIIIVVIINETLSIISGWMSWQISFVPTQSHSHLFLHHASFHLLSSHFSSLLFRIAYKHIRFRFAKKIVWDNDISATTISRSRSSSSRRSKRLMLALKPYFFFLSWESMCEKWKMILWFLWNCSGQIA